MDHELAVLSMKITEHRLERVRIEMKAMEGDLRRAEYQTKLAALSRKLADDLLELLEIKAKLISEGDKKQEKRLRKLDKKGIGTFAAKIHAVRAADDAELDICRDTLRDPSTHWSVRAAVIKWMAELPSADMIASVAPYAKDENPLVRWAVEEAVRQAP